MPFHFICYFSRYSLAWPLSRWPIPDPCKCWDSRSSFSDLLSSLLALTFHMISVHSWEFSYYLHSGDSKMYIPASPFPEHQLSTWCSHLNTQLNSNMSKLVLLLSTPSPPSPNPHLPTFPSINGDSIFPVTQTVNSGIILDSPLYLSSCSVCRQVMLSLYLTYICCLHCRHPAAATIISSIVLSENLLTGLPIHAFLP